VSRRGVVCDEASGPVITESGRSGYIGADCPSNNTGELSAIGQVLHKFATDPVLKKSQGDLVIRSDSKYAALSTTGVYNGAKNRELISTCRGLLDKVKQDRTVRFEHVKGHSGDALNERADYLANQGAAMARNLPARARGSYR